ncbi:MAG: hypothetical protein AAGF94_09070 [Pseudomonadota bacterium]
MSTRLEYLEDAKAGLDFERDLFEAEGQRVGFWTASKVGLVCPRAYQRRSAFAAAAERSTAHGWPVYLRPTGGGTVPQGPGLDNLVLAFDAPRTATIEDGYRLLTEVIKKGLGPPGDTLKAGETPGSFCDGAWNLSVRGQKVVGTAQRWRPRGSRKPRVLAHALILTLDGFAAGAAAVAGLHQDLGLGEVLQDAHTSLEAAFGLTELPVEGLAAAAAQSLAVIDQKAE